MSTYQCTHTLVPCRERPNLSSPSTGPSVSKKRGTVAIYEELYEAENGAKCIRSRAQESPHYMSQNHPQSAYFGHWTVKRSHQRLDCNFGKRTLPISASACAVRTQCKNFPLACAVCTACALSAHAVRTQCARSARTSPLSPAKGQCTHSSSRPFAVFRLLTKLFTHSCGLHVMPVVLTSSRTTQHT